MYGIKVSHNVKEYTKFHKNINTLWKKKIAFRGQQSSALAPYLDARDRPASGTAYDLTSTGSTGGIRSGSWRITPTPSFSTKNTVSKSQLGVSAPPLHVG